MNYKILNKENIIDNLLSNNKSNNPIDKLRILILINSFDLENNPKYINIKRPILFLQSNDHNQNDIYNSYENILWMIKKIKTNNIFISKTELYNVFNFIEEKYMNYLNKKEKNNKKEKINLKEEMKYNLDLFFIGGYPSGMKI